MKNCKNLKTIILTDNVEQINEGAFNETSSSSLETVYISSESNVALEGNYYGFTKDFYGLSNVDVIVYGKWPQGKWPQLGDVIHGKLENDKFGYSVAMNSDGTRIVIGAPEGGTENDKNKGYVRVYDRDSSNTTVAPIGWTQVGTDIVGESGAIQMGNSGNYYGGDESGTCVAMSSDGKRIAIGAIENDGNGFASGHVRVYDWNGSSWTKVGSDIDGENRSDRSGYSIAMNSSGSRIAIGAPYNNGNGTRSGHVRVYDRDSSNTTVAPIGWTLIGEIDGKAAGDWSGHSVAMSDDGKTIAIGAIDHNSKGHVRVYYLDGSFLIPLGSEIEGEADGDDFGYSVAMNSSGTRIAISAPKNDVNGNNSGHVRVYDYKIPTEVEWTNGNVIKEGDTTPVNGKFYWTKVGSDILGEDNFSNSGSSLAMSSDGSRIAIGTPYNGDFNNGHVRVYEYRKYTQDDEDNETYYYGTEQGSYWNQYKQIIITDLEDKGSYNEFKEPVVNNSYWTQVGLEIDGEDYDQLGHSVAMSSDGSIIAIGAPYQPNNDKYGSVRVYDSSKASFDIAEP